MGFLDYAWAVSLQKDNRNTKIRLNPDIQQPILRRENSGFEIILPLPKMQADKQISFLGYLLQEESGKAEVGKLFRACVLHLTTHTLIHDEMHCDLKGEPPFVERFCQTLVTDALANAYILVNQPDKLQDLAFADSLAFLRMKPSKRILNPATRIMASLLAKINVGIAKGKLERTEEAVVSRLAAMVFSLRQEFAEALNGKEKRLDEKASDTTASLIHTLESNGPVLEAPSLPHTELIGPSSVFIQEFEPHDSGVEEIFRESMKTLGGNVPRGNIESCWGREVDAEAIQAFDSWLHKKARRQKILSKIRRHLKGTRFESVLFPEEDYTQYLRARTLLRGGSRRLLDSLRVAQDALDEDPRKERGQLDLTEVVQKIASRSPRTDVFMENEYLSRSYAWGLLFDASASMRITGDLGRALAICVAEATKELLMDPGSWSFYAFNDCLYVLKDSSEAYSARVRARIGGLEFQGLTYMPDAIRVAGRILNQRFDEQKFLIVLSDGWPYGYPNISAELRETVDAMKKRGVQVIGVGIESERMNEFFREGCAVYSQRDLIKKFARIFINTSAAALEN
ncbi:MAG: hypothetical protein JSV64_08925 [Candidatus Bathyarchaeota archaeon]|nr:MAG: hypothetical protein JSV64_08925 [Candidatus Bathyarchaeota archaeon]